jgi:hypothetical protein
MNILMIPAGGIDPVDQPGKADTLRRLEAGLEAWNSGRFHYILVCGGFYLPIAIQTRAAADIMADWLIAHGVRREAILIEDRSVDSFENIAFGLGELHVRQIRLTTITVCSQWQHALRICITLWKRFWLNDEISIKMRGLHYAIPLQAWLSEWFMILYHLCTKHEEGWLARKNRARRLACTPLRSPPHGIVVPLVPKEQLPTPEQMCAALLQTAQEDPAAFNKAMDDWDIDDKEPREKK